jgi:hypothetical protein
MPLREPTTPVARTVFTAAALLIAELRVRLRIHAEAENLVLRRQFALFKKPGMNPQHIDAATRKPGSAVAVVRLALCRSGRPPGNRAARARSRMATVLAPLLR